MKVFSNSKISTYEQCPRKFKLHYIDKISLQKEAQNVEALMGSCVHNALRELYQQINDGKRASLPELLSFFSNQWEKSIQEEIVIPKKGLTLDHFKNNGLEMLKNYFNHYSPFNQSKTIALEKKVQFPLDEYEMMGFIDRISVRDEHVFEIHDYKTSSTYPTKSDIENDTQLSLYQIGLSFLYPNVDQVVLIWHFLKFDQEILITKTQEELEQTKQNTVSRIRKIIHDPYYSPNETSLCNWCLYQEFCSAKTHSVHLLSYSSAELDDGVQIVDEYIKIQNQLAKLVSKKVTLEEILLEIEKRAIEFASEKQYTKLVGKEGSLQIKDDWEYQFPKSTDPGRIKLENWLKNINMWDQVSMLQLPKLSKLIKNEVLSKRIHDGLMEFSEYIHIQKVKLIRKKSEISFNDLDEKE
jgi:putative RecB family exonuclease